MKNLLFKFFSNIFAAELAAIRAKDISKAEDQFRSNQIERRNQITSIEYEMMVGKPIIGISNEWADPIIGFAVCVDYVTESKNPVLIVKNYLTGKEVMLMGSVYYYSEQRFNALAKLDPFEICSIVYHNSCGEHDFEKNKSGVFSGYDAIRQRLVESVFYTDVLAAKQKELVE